MFLIITFTKVNRTWIWKILIKNVKLYGWTILNNLILQIWLISTKISYFMLERNLKLQLILLFCFWKMIINIVNNFAGCKNNLLLQICVVHKMVFIFILFQFPVACSVYLSVKLQPSGVNNNSVVLVKCWYMYSAAVHLQAILAPSSIG